MPERPGADPRVIREVEEYVAQVPLEERDFFLRALVGVFLLEDARSRELLYAARKRYLETLAFRRVVSG